MRSIRVKTSVFISLLLAASLALVVAAAAWFTQTETRAFIEDEIHVGSGRFAARIRAEIGQAQATARAMAAVAEAQLATGRTDRAALMQHLRLTLEAERGLFGTWIVFRPDAFDGLDAHYAGLAGHDRNGLINYYYVRQDGKVSLNLYDVTTDQTDQLARDWFKVPHDRNRDSIITPYLETFDGAQGDRTMMMTSAATPVRDRNGRPIGVAGVDLTLEGLQELVGPVAFAGAGTAAILSTDGRLVAHPRSDLLGADAMKAGYPFPLLIAVADGRHLDVTMDGPDGTERIFAEPIDFGIPGEAWSFVFRIPVDALEESSRKLWRGLLALGLLLLALAGAAGAWAGSSIARPIQDMTRAMRSIADGELDVAIPGHDQRDEVGDMARALVTFRDTARERVRLQASMVDLKSHNRAVEILNGELKRQNDRFDAALSNMSQGLCMLDASLRVIVLNDTFLRIYGLSPEAVKPGVSMQDILEHYAEVVDFGPEQSARHTEASLSRLKSGKASIINQTLPDGRVIEVSYDPMEGGGWVNTYEDVTERRRAEARIAHLAKHDPLTDLPNRTLFREQLEHCLDEAGETALLYIDLDRFKPVNDTLGHHVGDELLKAVAKRLREVVGAHDTVARFGGDEFGIVARGASPGLAAALAARAISALSAPFVVEGHRVSVGASIGITVSREAMDAGELLKEADLALYRAKADGRGTFRFFEPSMDAAVRERRALEIDLRQALDRDELDVHFQPIVLVGTRETVACEALMRWHHPTRGMVPPSDFISIAEESGLIGPLGAWVLGRACREAAAWPQAVKVSVNLSAAQFCGADIPTLVAEALAASGLDPRRLELEITESVLIQNSEATLGTLRRLNTMGVSIAMDDFGTGYSSLGYLRRFPFDKLKIDQSFVADLTRSTEAQAIVAAIVGLGTTLGMVTTAEGVETEEQLMLLKAAGCVQAQGYLFGRPVPSDRLAFGRAAAVA